MLRTSALRVLRPEDLTEVTELLSRDPVADVFVASRVA
ncbi:MAG TPA: GNAT family N-acetyltransferase, partial [Actinomycetes bacterium]|nr:GNAT family N-acetyltransferase [Actinomycetes bacterium]